MHNEKGEIIESYMPRKCSATGQVIHSRDYASVQINVGEVDKHGVFTGKTKPYILCGFVRRQAEADDSINRLTTDDGILRNVWKYNR
jgi:small subunit ribosomal protein S21e